MSGTIVEQFSKGKQVSVDRTLTWANSATANTTKTEIFKKGSLNPKDYEIIISNQSTASALNVEIGNIEPNFGIYNLTDSMKSVLTSITIPSSTALVIEDCEDAWNEQVVANVTVTADGTTKQVGTNSVKIAIGAGAPGGIVAATEAVSALNLSQYTHVYAWIYSDVALALGDFQLILDDSTNGASPLESLNIPAIPQNTWTRIRVPLVNPELDIAIISIGLKMVNDVGVVNIYIDDVTAVKMSIIATPIQAFRNGVDGFIRISNATALSSVQEFNAKVRVKELF